MTLLDDLAIETRRLCGIKKALIVSTRLPVAAAIVEQLGTLGYIASTNSIIAETLPRAEREQPDLVMLDGQLAAQNLQGLLQRLGISPKAKSVPIIFLGQPPPAVTPPPHLRVIGTLEVPVDPVKLEETLKRLAPETQPAAA
jgi:CheY-like chemotaxis protein